MALLKKPTNGYMLLVNFFGIDKVSNAQVASDCRTKDSGICYKIFCTSDIEYKEKDEYKQWLEKKLTELSIPFFYTTDYTKTIPRLAHTYLCINQAALDQNVHHIWQAAQAEMLHESPQTVIKFPEKVEAARPPSILSETGQPIFLHAAGLHYLQQCFGEHAVEVPAAGHEDAFRVRIPAERYVNPNSEASVQLVKSMMQHGIYANIGWSPVEIEGTRYLYMFVNADVLYKWINDHSKVPARQNSANVVQFQSRR